MLYLPKRCRRKGHVAEGVVQVLQRLPKVFLDYALGRLERKARHVVLKHHKLLDVLLRHHVDPDFNSGWQSHLGAVNSKHKYSTHRNNTLPGGRGGERTNC